MESISNHHQSVDAFLVVTESVVGPKYCVVPIAFLDRRERNTTRSDVLGVFPRIKLNVHFYVLYIQNFDFAISLYIQFLGYASLRASDWPLFGHIVRGRTLD